MQTLIKGARVLDPGRIDAIKDILIQDGTFAQVKGPGQIQAAPDVNVINADGLIAVPGLIDVHVHLREPGQEYKETIASGLKAAAAGGFTGVCAMPNTTPVNDNAQVTAFILSQGEKAESARVYPAGAISVGCQGVALAEIGDMKQAGIKAVTDDGLPVSNAQLMRRAMEYCKSLDMPILIHAEDKALSNNGAMNEGPRATALGIRGIPNASEAVMVSRDIALAELTGARIHFCHMSTAQSIDAIRQAKHKGLPVTCETAPHYFTLTDEDIPPYDTHFKMNPPLRSEKDRQAIIQGLKDGTIDMIATDHAPHNSDEKDVEFDLAAFGIVGLETALPLSLKLVQDGHLTLERLIELMAKAPAVLMGLNNDIKEGNPADVTLIDPETKIKIDPAAFFSKSQNTPFAGKTVTGQAVMTFVAGTPVFKR
ncbi:MAG: dihydroorotase [Desulfobacterales bacterium]|nr:MAG: dihydroorotase [Desulfobacterales bacterium]